MGRDFDASTSMKTFLYFATLFVLVLSGPAAHQALAQNDQYIPCNGVAYFLDDLGPVNVDSCVGTNPSLTARIHPASDEVVHPFGPTNTLISIEHYIYWRRNGAVIPSA